MSHRGHAPELWHHLRHHRTQVRLLALQFAEGIADMDALHLVGPDLAGLERAQDGFARHVGEVQTFARPGAREVGLVAAEDEGGRAAHDVASLTVPGRVSA